MENGNTEMSFQEDLMYQWGSRKAHNGCTPTKTSAAARSTPSILDEPIVSAVRPGAKYTESEMQQAVVREF